MLYHNDKQGPTKVLTTSGKGESREMPVTPHVLSFIEQVLDEEENAFDVAARMYIVLLRQFLDGRLSREDRRCAWHRIEDLLRSDRIFFELLNSHSRMDPIPVWSELRKLNRGRLAQLIAAVPAAHMH